MLDSQPVRNSRSWTCDLRESLYARITCANPSIQLPLAGNNWIPTGSYQMRRRNDSSYYIAIRSKFTTWHQKNVVCLWKSRFGVFSSCPCWTTHQTRSIIHDTRVEWFRGLTVVWRAVRIIWFTVMRPQLWNSPSVNHDIYFVKLNILFRFSAGRGGGGLCGLVTRLSVSFCRFSECRRTGKVWFV